LENWFRAQAGMAGYRAGFVEHYLMPLIYPSGLTRGVQLALGGLVVAINVALYSVVWTRYRRMKRS
jgi:hypothetical protein